MNKNKGFTLMELLVVISIIGILAAVILAALGGARDKGADAGAKSGLNQARIQADMYYASFGNYAYICSPTKDTSNPKGIYSMVLSSGKAVGFNDPVIVNGVTVGGNSQVRCNSDDSQGLVWAAEVPLKKDAGKFYCVDSTRAGIVTSISIGNSNGFCQQ